MWELDCEESWARKNYCFWTVVLEKTLESPLDCKEIQPVHSEGDQSWDFFGRMLKLKLQYFGHLRQRLDSLEKTDTGRDWGQEEKGTTEDEMVGWHHWLDGRESEWTPGVGDGQGGLACCDSWGCKELDMTERLNWNELNWSFSLCYGNYKSNVCVFVCVCDVWCSVCISVSVCVAGVGGHPLGFPYCWNLHYFLLFYLLWWAIGF